jgi:hypothetical protein
MTQYRKFQTNIPREGIAPGLSPNFHIHVSVSDLYIPTIRPYSAAGKYVDRSWEYINMNVEIGTEAAQFLFWEHTNGIFIVVYCTHAHILTHVLYRPSHATITTGGDILPSCTTSINGNVNELSYGKKFY